MTTVQVSNKVQVLCMPPDHLPYTLVSLAFFLPLGVIAVVQAFKVRKAVDVNDLTLAREASDKAAKYAMASVFIGTNMMMLTTCVVLCIFYQT